MAVDRDREPVEEVLNTRDAIRVPPGVFDYSQPNEVCVSAPTQDSCQATKTTRPSHLTAAKTEKGGVNASEIAPTPTFSHICGD
jgi:hypothetical protein